jgi:hypothetical protein
MSVPTLERLRADLGQTYWLTAPTGERIAGEVRAAHAGTPMNERYCCYSAQMAAAAGAVRRGGRGRCVAAAAGARGRRR